MAEEKKSPDVKGFSLHGWDLSHYKQTEAYTQTIDQLYNQAIAEFARLTSRIRFNPEKPFSFADYPNLQAEVNRIIALLSVRVEAVIRKGTKDQWLYANKKNDEFLQHILDTSKIDKTLLEKYQDHNLNALDSFQKRKTDGMDLRDRVWKYSSQFKNEIELGLDVALGEGTSAQTLSKELKQYLQNPDKLFRRVRDKRGELTLSKNAKAYHPGRGIYRSSHKNALRLTRTEINIAYRTSEQKRWNKLNFIVGYEIRLSNNHTLNGKPFKDICDDLAGRYPKWFVYKGWHPQCRCFAVPIFMDPDEFDTDELNELKAALKGNTYRRYVSRNLVNDVPPNFKEWIADNAERSQNWASQPYFVKDNFVRGRIAGGLKYDPDTEIQSNPELFAATLKAKESEIRNRPTEKAVILNDDGNVIFEKTSNMEDAVGFSRNELFYFPNNILVHNHPLHRTYAHTFIGKIGVSFSKQDIKVAISNNLKEMRVSTPTYNFSMKRPDSGWPDFGTASDMMDEISRSIITEFERMISDGLLTPNQANTLYGHMLWKEFSKRLNIEYSKKEVISPRTL